LGMSGVGRWRIVGRCCSEDKIYDTWDNQPRDALQGGVNLVVCRLEKKMLSWIPYFKRIPDKQGRGS
jgi:hypothetical protein